MIERICQALYDTQTQLINGQNKAEFLAGKIVFTGPNLNEAAVDVIGGIALGVTGGILYFNYKKDKIYKESDRDFHENVNYGCARVLWGTVGGLLGAFAGGCVYMSTH